MQEEEGEGEGKGVGVDNHPTNGASTIKPTLPGVKLEAPEGLKDSKKNKVNRYRGEVKMLLEGGDEVDVTTRSREHVPVKRARGLDWGGIEKSPDGSEFSFSCLDPKKKGIVHKATSEEKLKRKVRECMCIQFYST